MKAARAGLTDAELLSAAKQQLTPFLGPIAGKIVDQSAPRAGSAADLFGMLAQHIDNERDRERFLAGSPASASSERPHPVPDSANISNAELDSLARSLTPYLGPIAAIAAKRESRSCASLSELRQRLAALIPSERDRNAFLGRSSRP